MSLLLWLYRFFGLFFALGLFCCSFIIVDHYTLGDAGLPAGLRRFDLNLDQRLAHLFVDHIQFVNILQQLFLSPTNRVIIRILFLIALPLKLVQALLFLSGPLLAQSLHLSSGGLALLACFHLLRCHCADGPARLRLENRLVSGINIVTINCDKARINDFVGSCIFVHKTAVVCLCALNHRVLSFTVLLPFPSCARGHDLHLRVVRVLAAKHDPSHRVKSHQAKYEIHQVHMEPSLRLLAPPVWVTAPAARMAAKRVILPELLLTLVAISVHLLVRLIELLLVPTSCLPVRPLLMVLARLIITPG